MPQQLHIADGFAAIVEAAAGHSFLESNCMAGLASAPDNVPAALESAFAKKPSLPAVEFGGQVLSRKELGCRVDQLAFWLLRHEAGSGGLVGIYMDRSIEMLIAVLAVMKAGSAYVPLDPSFPRERLEQIVEETEASILLTLERNFESVPRSKARTLCLDSEASNWQNEPPRDLPTVLPEMLAYVIFTSGSTGKPKGVEITHGSVMNLLTSAAQLLEVTEKDRLVAITTLAFDISVLELLLPLVTGGTVVVASREEVSDAVLLKELLKNSGATILQGTPVTFRSLMELGFEPPQGFKMLCGGEAWSPMLAEKLLATGGRLWNMYGPTETTVWSSINEVEPGTKQLTIGPPIEKTHFYVMDEFRQPVQAGTQGELWIAGAGVARGYFGREGLTAERFVADPWVAGERMYRTGDAVRQLPDGKIEFIGRLDQQIKLRGFRIELGEIEAAMVAVPEVKQAVAVLRKDALGEDFIAGFYVADNGVAAGELDGALRKRLPAYMVPMVFFRLESLPLTPSGKTDRRALAQVELRDSDAPDGCLEPRCCSEEDDAEGQGVGPRMLAIWQKLFPGSAIIAASDFFDLGGDSLLLVRLQSMVAREFNLRLTMADMTRHVTFGSLTKWAEDTKSMGEATVRATEMNPSLLPLQTFGNGEPIFIIPQMLIFRTLAEELGPEQPVYALQIMDEHVTDAMASASFEELATLYTRLIRQVQPEGPYRLGGWCLWGWMAYAVARLLELQGAEVEMLVIVDAWAPGYWNRFTPLRQFFVNASHFGQRVRWYADTMNSLPVADRIDDGLRRIRGFFKALITSLPRGLRPELEVVETMRIQQFASRAAETYRPGPIKANVLLFKSQLRPTGQFIGEDMGWTAVLGRHVDLHTLPGNHTEIFELPAARMMASRMRDSLGRDPEIHKSAVSKAD